MDVVGSLVLIVLTSPIMLGVAIGVKLSSPGPIIFKQERVGLNKRPFMMYKFRSMRVNAAEDSAWSTNSDPAAKRGSAALSANSAWMNCRSFSMY